MMHYALRDPEIVIVTIVFGALCYLIGGLIYAARVNPLHREQIKRWTHGKV